MKMNVVDFAWQVIEMQRTLDAQELQITRLMRIEEDYNQLLQSSIEHGRAMMGNVLKLCMMPGVVGAYRVAEDAGLGPNVEANRHFAVGRVWARLFKPKPGPPQSVRLSDQLGVSAFVRWVIPDY